MELWMILAALTIGALVLVMLPVIYARRLASPQDAEYDVRVYRDQLAELENDKKRGVIADQPADSARNEIARRLLKAQSESDSKQRSTSSRRSNVIAFAAMAAVVISAALMYKKIGRPELPDQPHKERIAKALKSGDMQAMIWQVQAFLRKNPGDIKGWKALAPALMRVKRYGEAADAYAKIMKLQGTDPHTLTDYAESLLLANRGTPTAQAKTALLAALKTQPKYPKARFYWAMVLQQEGKPREALKQWRLLMAQNPKNLQLQMAAQRQIATLKLPDVKMPALDKSQRDAAASMTAKDRQAMINSMVDRLASKLAENPENLDGWFRLIRAQVVLGRRDAALKSLKTANNTFKNKTEALAKLEKFSAALGLNDKN